MGIRVRKKGGKWFVFVTYYGRRKAKCVGSKAAAEEVKRILEAKLALGDGVRTRRRRGTKVSYAIICARGSGKRRSTRSAATS
jgi:hypothetical protein